MIRINLLPHREEARKAKRQRFYAMVGAAVVLGALVVFLGVTIINSYISSQAEANEFLKREIAVLDKQIAEINQLKEKTQALLARKQIIEDLQRDRGETVYLLTELVKQVPEVAHWDLVLEFRKISLPLSCVTRQDKSSPSCGCMAGEVLLSCPQEGICTSWASNPRAMRRPWP